MEMDSANKPPTKTSNISDIVFKFAKVCKLRSMGVFNSDSNANVTEDSSDVTEEAECEGGKIHPGLVEIRSKADRVADVEISRLFDTISALKVAYVKLQEAHIPYDTEKITAANELVVAQFGELYKNKHACKEKLLKDVNSVSHLSTVLLDQIQVQEKHLEKMKFQVKVKNTEILNLHKKLAGLDLLNTKMVEILEKKEKEIVKDLDTSFGEIYKDAAEAIHDFAKPLISLMKASGWDLDQAVKSIESSVVYAKRSHKKYAFEAYIARKMFNGILSNPSKSNPVMSCNDPFGYLIRVPDSDFAKFCQHKYLNLIHPMMEASFFGNLDHRTLVSNGKHPKTQFYEAYVKMAWRIWVLQNIAISSEPKAEIYGVKRGTEFSDAYMVSVVDLNENMVVPDQEVRRFKVEFMVIPGFKIGNIMVKSCVYLSTIRS